MGFQQNFCFLWVISQQKLHEGKSRGCSVISHMRRKASSDHTAFSSNVYHIEIPRMRIETIRCQNNGIILNGFRNQTKYLMLPFWIGPALRQAATETGKRHPVGSFHVVPMKIKLGGTHLQVACR
jgi:hypothetical protein